MDEEKKRSSEELSREADSAMRREQLSRAPGSLNRNAPSGRQSAEPGRFDPAAWQRRQETAEFARKYAGAVRGISDALPDRGDRPERRETSPELERFRDAAGRAADALERKEPDRAELDRSMKSLFESAKVYDDRCTHQERLDPKTAPSDELLRWQAAKAAALLQDVYSGPAPAEPVSLRSLNRQTGLGADGYDFARSARTDAEEKAQKLLHGTPEERNAVASQLSSFFDNREHTRLDPNRLGGMTPSQQFEYLRSPENRAALESVMILAAHAEDAVSSLQRSGQKLSAAQVSDMTKKSRHMAAFADGMMFALDPKQYEADRVNSTPELREFKTLGTRLKTAMTALDGVEPNRTARLTADRSRDLKPMEDPSVQPPSKKAPQRGGPSM